ncbi:MAG: hypothetical protein ACKVRP_01600 [Bacteroidota bacterium]
MKRRKQELTDQEEQQVADDLRTLMREKGIALHDVRDRSFFSRLLVQTNNRIDDAASGKAISMSWAARVAIPGVVAIISFFIGLYYYTPPSLQEGNAILPVLSMLPDETIDSLLVQHPSFVDASLTSVGSEVFDVSGDEAAEYLISSGSSLDAVETMNEEQLEQVLAILGSHVN